MLRMSALPSEVGFRAPLHCGVQQGQRGARWTDGQAAAFSLLRRVWVSWASSRHLGGCQEVDLCGPWIPPDKV